MSVSESQRRLVHEKLEQSIGAQAADLMLEMLPRQTHAELVTRDDMTANTILLRGEMAQWRAQLTSEMGELRAELKSDMGELRAELRGEMGELRAELKSDMGELRADVRTEIAGLQRWLAGAVAANAIAVVTALLV